MNAHEPQPPRRWLILAVIGVAQLMVVLDITVVNIALPSAQHALGFSTHLRQWIVTSYALAFGSLLLLGGRLGDVWGRKSTFVTGLIGFAIASGVGGAAQSFGMLVAARGAQGVFAALLAPSALAILSTTFTDGRERSIAYAIFSSIAMAGGAIGLLLGGALTQLFSWRYSLFINLALAVPAVPAAFRLLDNRRNLHAPLDIPGVLTSTAGLFCLVYGFSSAETHSWSAPLTILPLAAAVLLLASFVAIESRVRTPLLPLRVIANRARGGSYLAFGTAGLATFAAFLFITYFLQRTKGFTPIQTGLAFMPMALAVVASTTLVQIKLLKLLGARLLITGGLLISAGAMAWLAQITPASGYFDHVMPALIALGVGIGSVSSSAIFTATYQVDREVAGVASAMVNTTQQISGAVGTALLSTIAASAVNTYARAHADVPNVLSTAAVHGYTTAFWVATAILASGAIVLVMLLPSIKANTNVEPRRPSGRALRGTATVLRGPER